MGDVQKIELYENVITSLFSKLKEQDNSFLREKNNTNTTEKAMSLLDWANKEENFVFDNVYAYIFQDLKSVYIGRTTNLIARDKQHRMDKDSAVFKFSQTNSVEIPIMTILERNISLEDGIKMESFYCSVATRNGWTKEYTWLKRLKRENGYWTKERCMEEAKKYKNKKHFEKGCPSAYSKAYLMGWLRDFDLEDARPQPLTYQEVYDIAKKYKKLTEFRKEEPRVLDYALRHKWLNSFTWLTKRDVSKKIVQQYDKDMNLIATFDSIKEACDVTGLSRSGISNCCRGVLKTSQGFIWKFSENT